MKRVLVTTAIISVWCAACVTVGKVPADARLVKAQQAFDDGQKLRDAGQYQEALLHIEHALQLRETVLGGRHLEVSSCLELLGDVRRLLGEHVQAEPLLQRALTIKEATFGKNHPSIVHALDNLARLYKEQGDLARAEPLYERMVVIQEAAFGKNHPSIVRALSNLALLNKEQERYARAESLYERALAIREATFGKNHPEVANLLSHLALVLNGQQDYERAELLYGRALEIRRTALGENHPDFADTLHSLALLYVAQAHYLRAEPLYERALVIREASLGKNHPAVADALQSLALLYAAQGHYTQVEPLYERALAIREASLGKNHPEVALLLDGLAAVYTTRRHYARAKQLQERALAIGDAALGKHHSYVARSLSNLAHIYMNQGQYAQAEPLYERALAMREAAFGNDHPEVAESLSNFARFHTAQGFPARAGPLYERALAIREAALGKKHPEVAQSLHQLALNHLAQKQLAQALPLFEQAFTVSEAHLRQEVFGFSEARLASALHLLRMNEERLYGLVRAHPDHARVRHLALTAALLHKDRSVEEVSNTSRIVYRDLSQADRENFERLRVLRTRFAQLSFAGPGQHSPVDYQQRLKALADQGDILEAELARRSQPLRALHVLPPPHELLGHVAETLPQSGVLVEFVVYRDHPLVPTPSTPSTESSGDLRYLALLLFANGRTHALDLGPAAPIDQAAQRLRDALASRAVSYQLAAEELYALTFRPLVPHLGEVQQLFIAPDGQLSLVPFAALHDGRRFIVDAWNIIYLTSGKDLLHRAKGNPSAHSVVVLADPDFSASTAAYSHSEQDPPAERSSESDRFFSLLRSTSNFADPPWLPLPGTRKEAAAIQSLFPQAQLLLGPDATKKTLLKLETPGVLHIATHGFFLDDEPIPAGTRGARAVVHFGASSEAGPASPPPDPLLRSGLVLAGAYSPGASRYEDSLVTALELAGMNLWGTQLVVLSACDTGRGNVKLGEGVYGLRRALMLAGAEAVVTSLWKVNDETTVELMEGYYRRLLAGEGRGTALLEAMRELRQKMPHPYYWAPFITIGQDKPLQLNPPMQLNPPSGTWLGP